MNVGAAPSAASPSHEMVSRGPTVGNLGMAEASRMSSNPPSGIHHTAGSAPLRSGEGASTSSLTKDISISTGSEALAQQTGHSSSTPIAAETKRRVMPVRLRRVSTLLAGSKLEDDLPGSSSKLDGYVLPASATILLTTDENVEKVPYENPLLEHDGALSLFADPEMAKACRERQIIETPDFRPRDDTELMGKTRSIKSQEDTSDAAYERRHRKHDNLEKKQRKLEKEGLVRDRAKVERRVKELTEADPRSLMWLLEAREKQQQQQQQHHRQSENSVATPPSTAAETATDADTGATTIATSTSDKAEDAAALTAKLERVRAELLEEANELLKRYDALLPNLNSESAVPARAEKRRKMQGEEGSGADDSDHGRSAPSGRKSLVSLGKRPTKVEQGTVPKAKKTANAASTSLQSRRSVSAALPATASTPDRAALPHSRYLHTSASPVAGAEGRRAAGKRARSSSGSASAKQIRQHFKPEDGKVRAETTYANIHARTSGGRFAPKSALVPGAEPPSASTTPATTPTANTKTAAASKRPPRKSKESAVPSPRGTARRKSLEAMKKAAAEPKKKLQKVKLIFNRRGAQNDGVKMEQDAEEDSATVATPSSSSMAKAATTTTTTSANARPAALTLEEAQALFAQDMSDDDDDDGDVDADADADGEADVSIKRSD